ncbi:Na(+)/H(+) exchange regulatory cofactor NHE-RF1 [Ceratitis capitata]|nr:Na(+)/H(+) exchange regulatory cofactor NHE-RF1 [Ceratitis capitata]XP_004537667.1 Na(+)/H(+) exchange regulatory cofactor NHE-RF1 [Ceratitis capitata]XP_012162272.1 Na(+)/H(+) exchange regulatory cofactor NHE-RF1 [Ceratitis capitata]CAD7001556.1 unnamed protein product [Ceratitis capitata]
MHRTESSEKQNMSSAVCQPTKVCHMVKRADFEGYGFNLHSEKMKPGQYIGKVDPQSPAEAAGLKEGDRIIEVNGVNINQESHKQVVQRIKAMSNEVRLLIVLNVRKDDETPTEARLNETEIKQSYHIDENLRGDYGTKHELPGFSKSINNISVTSSKRPINGDVDTNKHEISFANLNNVNEILLRKQDEILFPSTTFHTSSSLSVMKTPTNFNETPSGGLDLPMTVAEMRAKLLSKKKYDPKNEIVDLRKKFEIIQKL